MSGLFDYWQLIAGLGIFLFAMVQLENSLRQLAGKSFQTVISKSTNKPYKSVLTGIVTTTIVQSSSLVGLIVLAFSAAGILPLANAIGVVLGSNLGTTFTGWIVATLGFKLDLSRLIYPMIGFGGLAYGLLKGKLQSLALFFVSLSLLLTGLEFMKDSTSVVSENLGVHALQGYPLIVYLLAGVVVTAIIQSSSAVMTLTLSAVHSGLLSVPEAAAIVIGADLGTTSTVIIGSLQGAVIKRRLALSHLLFNFIVDVVAFLSIKPLLLLISSLNIEDPLFTLVAFHSSFNLIGILVFLPFIKPFAKLLEKILPQKQVRIEKYIHAVPASVGSAAYEALNKEVKNLFELVLDLNSRYLHLNSQIKDILPKSYQRPESLSMSAAGSHYAAIKDLEGKIISYAYQIQSMTAKSNGTVISESPIQPMMEVTRWLVYSAKSLKDIETDINEVHLLRSQTAEDIWRDIISNAETVLNSISHQLDISDSENPIEGDLASMYSASDLTEFHQVILIRLYAAPKSQHLSPGQLSTLLNMNKEVETSLSALLTSAQKFGQKLATEQ